MEKQDKTALMIIAILLGILLFLNLLLIIIMPALIVLEIILFILEYFTIKKIREINQYNKEVLDKQNELISKGYVKIYDTFFINEKKSKLIINGHEYNFSQIIDCELIESNGTFDNTFGKTKIKNNSIKTHSLSVETNYCIDLYINITVDDFKSPKLKLNIIRNRRIIKNSKKYNEMLENANNILSTLKLIKHKNNETLT